jgi:hypothetical protein
MIKPTHETDVVPKCSHVFPGSSAACASDLGAAATTASAAAAPAPAATAPAVVYQNPAKLTPDQYGAADGWRLLHVQELDCIPADAEAFSNFYQTWCESFRRGRSADEGDRQVTTYRTRTPETVGVHNPERLTPAQVGAGYRLLTTAEAQCVPEGAEAWGTLRRNGWSRSRNAGKMASQSFTYRIRVSEAVTRAFAAKHPHTSIPLPPNRRWCLEGEDVLPQDEVLFDDGRLFSCMDWPGHRGHKYAAAGTDSYPEGHYVRPVTEAEQPSSLAVDETQQRLERLAASLVDLVQNNNRLHVDEAGHVCGMYSRTSEGIRKDVAAFLAGVERAAERRAKAEQEVKFQALSQVEAACLREENKHLRHQVEILGRDVAGSHRKMTGYQNELRELRAALERKKQELESLRGRCVVGPDEVCIPEAELKRLRTQDSAWISLCHALSSQGENVGCLLGFVASKRGENLANAFARLRSIEKNGANDREQARLWGVVVEELRVGFSVENGNAQLSLEDCVRKELRRLYAVEKGRNEDAELLDWVSTREANIRRLDSGRYHVSYRPEWCLGAAAGGATLREALQRAKAQDERDSAKHAVA